MHLSLTTGRIKNVTWVPSPNFDNRAHPKYINMLIIHAISLPPRKYDGNVIEDFFCNTLDHSLHPYFKNIDSLKVSAHFYIKRSGEIIQFVNTQKRAWHAGQSVHAGFDVVNDFSIGIELQGCDEEPFLNKQYESLIQLSRCLMQTYPAITHERIKGHSDISPGRKTDPGPCFDWQYYLNRI